MIQKCVLYVVQLQHAEVGKKEKGKENGQIKGNVWRMNQIKIQNSKFMRVESTWLRCMEKPEPVEQKIVALPAPSLF